MSLQIGNIVKLTAEMEMNTAYFAIKGENLRGMRLGDKSMRVIKYCSFVNGKWIASPSREYKIIGNIMENPELLKEASV